MHLCEVQTERDVDWAVNRVLLGQGTNALGRMTRGRTVLLLPPEPDGGELGGVREPRRPTPDNAREDRQITWAAISQEVGVATSTIRRFATASDAEADGVLALVGWLGVAPEQFVTDSKIAGSRRCATRKMLPLA